MAMVTDFRCVDENGQDVPCDAFGNNVALSCPKCGHPVLAIMREHQRGSAPSNLAACRKKDWKGWLIVDSEKGLLRLQSSSYETT